MQEEAFEGNREEGWAGWQGLCLSFVKGKWVDEYDGHELVGPAEPAPKGACLALRTPSSTCLGLGCHLLFLGAHTLPPSPAASCRQTG